MNLFILDEDYQQAAEYYQDLHVQKIPLEGVQILQTAYSLEQLAQAPRNQQGKIRGHGYFNHPVCKWARQNINNFYWALFHTHALHEEFIHRFGHSHFSKCFSDWCFDNPPNLPDSPKTQHPQCFKDYPQLISADPVVGYRKYYKVAKNSFVICGQIVRATWTNRPTPDWFLS